MDKLFEIFFFVKNDSKINVFFLDDGSNDNSYEKAKVLNDHLREFYYIQLTPKNSKRTHAYLGQLEGLQYILNNFSEKLNNYIQFLDSDDWLPDCFFDNISPLLLSLKYQIIFNKVINIIEGKGTLKKSIYPIKRKIGQYHSKIWPTIMPTSSIITSKKFLIENKDPILDLDTSFDDVWLDSRINILAMNNHSSEIHYSQISVNRRLHESNDSCNGGLKRKILKQVQATSYLNKYLKKKSSFNLRTFLLEKFCVKNV